MADLQYISQFLAKVEGKCVTEGYIPCNKKSGGTGNYRGGPDPGNYIAMGASGVTIATGCDLGQTNAATLQSYGLADEIISLYTFYFGKKRDNAIYALHQRPLKITSEAARATDTAVHKGYLDKYVRPAYEKASGVNFDSLPRQAQAVIMSGCFQKGCGGVAREWPRLWGALCACNWQAATNELLRGFRQYTGRRHKEGRLLSELLRQE